MKRLIIAVVLLSLSSITSYAQNWPSFRGPNASGVAERTNPPLTRDVEKSHNVLWRTTIPGLSHASPIAWRAERNEITSWTTPTIYEGKNRVELIANGGRYIRGYDPLTQGMLIVRGEHAIYALGKR